MPSTFTSSLRLVKQATGENTETWGEIFNQQFANRIENYYSQNISSQQLMDLYLASAKGFFKDSLIGKYDGLAEETTTMFKECVGELDHILSKEEIDNVKQVLTGLSWNLSN